MYGLYYNGQVIAVVIGQKRRWGGNVTGLNLQRLYDFEAIIYTSAKAAKDAVLTGVRDILAEQTVIKVKPARVRKAYTVWVPEVTLVPHLVAAFNEEDARERAEDDDSHPMNGQEEHHRRISRGDEEWRVEPAAKRFQEHIISTALGEELGRDW